MRAFHDDSFRLLIPANAGLISVKDIAAPQAREGSQQFVNRSAVSLQDRWSGVMLAAGTSTSSVDCVIAAPTHSDFLFVESENSLGQSIFDPTELNHQGLKRWRGDPG
jgi:hypothetical protein